MTRQLVLNLLHHTLLLRLSCRCGCDGGANGYGVCLSLLLSMSVCLLLSVVLVLPTSQFLLYFLLQSLLLPSPTLPIILLRL